MIRFWCDELDLRLDQQIFLKDFLASWDTAIFGVCLHASIIICQSWDSQKVLGKKLS